MSKQSGLTLIELLVALAIMGIIIMVAIPRYNHFLHQRELATIRAALMTLQSEQKSYRLKFNRYREMPPFQLVDSGYAYRIEAHNVTVNTFTLIATREGEVNSCHRLTIDQHFVKTPQQCWR